ncbi:MAG: sensor histidine kinase [Steroidobacteraceae bacterium]
MRKPRLQSLQLRLAVRVTLLYAIATVITIGVLLFRAYDTTETLNERELTLRARDLARSVSTDAEGKLQLILSSGLATAYAAGTDTDIFAIRTPQSRVLAASSKSFGERVSGWPAPTDDPSYFHLTDLGRGARDYYGLSIEVGSVNGPLWVSVARADGKEELVDSLLWEFLVDVAWLLPILVVLTVLMGVLAIRSGLAPVRTVSEQAAAIGPGTTAIRLPEADVPSEIAPLVAAVNRALDRLEQGFNIQRQFTANAAHELRTPLAIVTAALETIEGNGDLLKVRADVARMNRLVEQLLHVARLDAVALDVSRTVDLNEIAKTTVATMAPWTIAQERKIALIGAEEPVTVKGDAHAITDALRNLIENAVHNSPPGEEVVVMVHGENRVSVADHGPGIAPEYREHLFKRFWRGPGARTGGAGLGLAIVSEIVKIHGGTVSIEDNAGGGVIFTLCFPVASDKQDAQLQAGI